MNRTRKLVIGAGPTGTHTAQLLADAGEEVTVVSRRGTSAGLLGVDHVALDASDANALTELAGGASTIFNCAMPRYDRWPQEFPPIAEAVLKAAERSGADLVTLSNVYGYGPVNGPLNESMPMAPQTVKGRVRAAMWEDALASRARVTEVRGSDYLGRGAASLYTLMTLPSIARGKPASFPGDLDALHSWTFTLDVARTLVAASRFAGSWGRAWHVPSNDLSLRALSARAAEIAAAPAASLTRMPMAELEGLGAFDTIMREVIEMTYLYDRPLCLNSTATQQALGVRATPIDKVLRDTLSKLTATSNSEEAHPL
jgi:nucleoside-diphosphate-sugar epimerase